MYFHFSTVVWGAWHTGIFVDVNLPSLLADGNLPAFVAQHTVKYRIFTTVDDVERISSHPAYKKAAQHVEFEMVTFPRASVSNPIEAHHRYWRRSIYDARQQGAMILFVPPDVVWSDGAFGHIAKLVTSDKAAVFMTYVRVVAETCLPALQGRYLSNDRASLAVSSRQLVDEAFRHIHPLTITYMHDSPNFPTHPEFILWRVPGEGYLMRVLVREMFAYNPNDIALNESALPAHQLDPKNVHFITDSDDLFALSFAPLSKDVEWFNRPRRLDKLTVGGWWLAYDSPANDMVSREYFEIHLAERTPERWTLARRQSDIVMSRLAGAREILRVLRDLPDQPYEMARGLIAMALLRTRLPQLLKRHDGPVTIVMPSDKALAGWLNEDGKGYLERSMANRLGKLLFNHVIVGLIDLDSREERSLKTLAGGVRQLTWQGDTAHIDGVPIEARPMIVASDWSYTMDRYVILSGGVLPPLGQS